MTSATFTGNPGLGNSANAQTTTQTNAAVHPTHNTVGMTPFQFRAFCQYFKIKDVTRLNLGGGQVCIFQFQRQEAKMLRTHGGCQWVSH